VFFSREGTNSGNIECVTDTGAAVTVTQPNPAVDPTVWHIYRIEMSSSNVVFKVDGTTVATHTTNLPGGTTPLTWNYSLRRGNGGTTVITSDIDYVILRQSR
jgi:hypothetical protein